MGRDQPLPPEQADCESICPEKVIGVGQFDEQSYLERYTDVSYAVDRGEFASGRAHYDLHGRAEGRIATQIFVPEQVELDAASCIMTVPSPALVTKPPVVIGLDKIPDDLLSMYQALWHHDRPASEIACHLLYDVIVVGDGLVFDMSGRFVAASAHQTSARQIEQAAIKVRDFLADGACSGISGTTVLCEKIGVGNYFHWLVEMAPIAFMLRERLVADWFLRAPIVDNNSGLTAVMRDSLDLLGVDPARIRWTTGALPQRYGQVILPRGFSYHGAAYSPLASTAMAAMAARVPADGKRRIWVSRVDYRRRMEDEVGLCDALAARGWTIVSPGSMSLRRQIALFKGAEVVAGVNGAGLTNLGFSPNTAQVIVFAPARISDISFWLLAQMNGQSYTEVRCRQEHAHAGAFNWEGMLMMRTSEALEHIDAVLAR